MPHTCMSSVTENAPPVENIFFQKVLRQEDIIAKRQLRLNLILDISLAKIQCQISHKSILTECTQRES